MNLYSLLNQYKFQTKKSLGQNFLKNEKTLQLIADTGEITKTDTVLEIGPGLGTLTNLLCQQAGQVTAIEKDRKLLPILRECLSKHENLTLVEGDALEFNPEKSISSQSYKIIANIPYYITSPLINHFLKTQFLKPKSTSFPPTHLILLTQKEVAEKICSQKKQSVLSLNVQTFAEAKLIETIPASDFIPAPKVDSAILKITVNKTSKISKEYLDTYFQIIHASFRQKRKTIFNSLKNNLLSSPGPKPIPKLEPEQISKILESSNISPTRRAETLTIDEWSNLAVRFNQC